MYILLTLAKIFRSEKMSQKNREIYGEGKVSIDPAGRLQHRDMFMNLKIRKTNDQLHTNIYLIS